MLTGFLVFVSVVLLLWSFFSVCYFNTLCQMLAFTYTCDIIQICMPYLNVQTFITCIYISFNVTLHISMHLCHTLYTTCLLNTVDYRYLEVRGTLWNNLRYLYLDISDLQNWEKREQNTTFHKWICNLNPEIRSKISPFSQCFVSCC